MSIGASRQVRAEASESESGESRDWESEDRSPDAREPRVLATAYCSAERRVAVCTSQAQTLAWIMATHASERRERRSRAALDLPVPASTC
jgi:hypothetical protein